MPRSATSSKGFDIDALSEVIIPKTPAFGDPNAWNHRYLFVDFPSADEANRAAMATNGRQAWGVKIKVERAKDPDSRKPGELEAWNQDQMSTAVDTVP